MSLWQSAQVSRTNDSRPSLARDTRNLTQRQAVKYLCHHHHHYHAHYQDYDFKIIAIMLPSPIFWSSISISSVLIFMYHFNSSASVRTSDRRNSINLVAQKSKSHWLTGLTLAVSHAIKHLRILVLGTSTSSFFLRETVCGFENYTNCLSILRPNVIIAPLYFPLRMNWSTVFARSHLPRVPSLLPPPGLSLWENRENWKINQAPEAAAAPRGELQKGAQVRCLSSVGAKYWLGCDWKYYLPAGVEEG